MNHPQWQFGEGNEYLSLDFARCQRPDGSYYGTGGTCRKGTPVGPREVKAIAKKAKDGDDKAKKALEKLAGQGDADAKKALEGMGGEKKAAANPDDEAKEVLKGLSDDDYAKVTAATQEDMDEMDGVIQDVKSKLNQEESIVEDERTTIEGWREDRLAEYEKSGKDPQEFIDADKELAGEFDRYVQNRNGLGQNDDRNTSFALTGQHPTVQPDDDFNEMATSLGEKAYAALPGGKTPSDAQALAMGLRLMEDEYGGFNVRDYRGVDDFDPEAWMGINPYYTKWNGPGDGPT